MGLDPAELGSCHLVERTNFVSPDGHSVVLRTGGGVGPWLGAVPRQELDDLLLKHARSAGAQVIEDSKVIDTQVTGDGVLIRMENGRSLHSPVVVAADGAWSGVRRSVEGASPSLSKWQATRMYLEEVDGPAAQQAFVWFDADLLPGYSWSFPLGDGRVNLGVGALREAGGGGGWIMRRTEQLLAERRDAVLGRSARVVGRPVAWPIPTDFRRERLTAAGHRVLFVGDAAGATDPMTGEGIAEALITGRLAAEAVSTGRPDAYARSAWKVLGGRHRRRTRCSRLLSSRFLAGLGLRIADLGPVPRRLFTGWVFS